jgi:hypothetical protein
MKILVLDDDKSRLRAFQQKLIGAVVTCDKLKNEDPFDVIFLDHDLGGKIYVPSGPGTGWEVAEWLKNNPEKKPKKIIFHTLNENGARCMKWELPEAIYMGGIFLMDFNLSNLSDLEDLEKIYYKYFFGDKKSDND